MANPAETTQPPGCDDLFAEALDLEQEFYTEGYNLGVRDGETAGRREGRAFGLEKGFEKFAAIGRLGGRAAVWQAQVGMTGNHPSKDEKESGLTSETGRDGEGIGASSTFQTVEAEKIRIGPLVVSDRTRKHIIRLGALTNLDTLSMENSEKAVDAFDERFREAKSKAALIARAVGETQDVLGEDEDLITADETDVVRQNGSGSRTGRAGLRVRDGRSGIGVGSGEMEDFIGLPGARR